MCFSTYSVDSECVDEDLGIIGFQLLDEPDKATRIGLSALPFLADLGRHSPHLLPSADHPGERYLGQEQKSIDALIQ